MVRFSRFAFFFLTILVLLLFGSQAVVPPVNAATIEKLVVSCTWVFVSGKTEVAAPYVRVQVALASNLTNVLADTTISTSRYIGAKYQALLNITPSHVPNGTLLVISAGEWDGRRYLRPATLTSRPCGSTSATPTPPPLGSPTPTPFPQATPTPPPISSPTRTPPPLNTPTRVPTQSVSQTPPPTPTRP